tara:strand:- start:21835 stop:22863 length:1029 start_codon:yes stop_codon:yes gene_type:complete
MSKYGLKSVNLALQGGGSHGAFTWGVLNSLLEDTRLDIEAVSGVSSGAMNACILASGLLNGDVEEAKRSLTSFWQAVSAKYSDLFESNPVAMWKKAAGFDSFGSMDTYLSLTQTFSPYQLNPFNLNPLRDILNEQIDFELIRNKCPIKLYIGATAVKTGKMRVFTNAEITADVLLASACLPAFHHAIEIDGEPYWDGAFSGNPPLFPLVFNSEYPDVIVVMLQPLLRESIPKTAEEIQKRSHELMFTNTFLREMRAIALSKEQIKKDWMMSGSLEKKMSRLNVHIIEDSSFEKLDASTRYSADSRLIEDLCSRGYTSSNEWLTKNYRSICKRSSVDLKELFA